MSKESILKTDSRVVFKETFGSEDLVRRNSGTPVGITFSNGVGSFNGTSSWLSYNQTLNGTYSVRMRFNTLTPTLGAYLFDFRNLDASGTGYVYFSSAVAMTSSTGSRYVDGVLTDTISSSTKEIVVTGITISSILPIIGRRYSAANYLTAGIELVEIYKGTLTANEVKNLYENRQNREINNYSKQLVANPDFLTDTSWGKESGWTISSGAARCDGTNSARLTQNLGMIATQQYKVSYKINVTSGSVSLLLGGNGAATVISANSETSEIKVSGATASETIYLISTNFVGSIDYIYVEQIAKEILRVDARNGVISNKYSGSTTGTELLTNGTFDSGVITGWSNGVSAPSTYSITDGILTLNRDGVNCFLNQAVEVIGKTYRAIVRYRVTAGTPGFQIWHGSGAAGRSPDLTSTTWTEYIHTAVCTTATSFYLYLGSNGSVEVDWVKCEEVIPAVTPIAVSVVRSGDVYAMDFNGSTSKIDCGSYDGLTGNKTFIGWFKARSYGEGGYGRFIDNGKVMFSVYTSSNRIGFSSDGYSTTALSAVNSVTFNNQYVFICATRTSTGITNIYINGVLSGTANQSSGTPATGTNNIILGNNNAGSYTFDGQISNVRIIDGILSTQEIAQLWQNEKSLYNL